MPLIAYGIKVKNSLLKYVGSVTSYERCIGLTEPVNSMGGLLRKVLNRCHPGQKIWFEGGAYHYLYELNSEPALRVSPRDRRIFACLYGKTVSRFIARNKENLPCDPHIPTHILLTSQILDHVLQQLISENKYVGNLIFQII